MSTRKPPRPISPLYARYLTSDEKKSLRAIPVDDLSSEINLMRVLFSHLMKLQQPAPKDMDSRAQTMRTSLVLGQQFTKLIYAHNQQHDPLVESRAEIFQALEEFRIRLGFP